jgi:hypothetical protein
MKNCIDGKRKDAAFHVVREPIDLYHT